MKVDLNLDWTMISSESAFFEALEETKQHGLICIDTETTKVERYGDQIIIGVAWGFPKGSSFRAFYAPFRHGKFPGNVNLDPSLLTHFNELKGKDQIYHNAIFDLTVFLKEGVDFTTPQTFIWDTMVMSHLCNEHEFSYSLDSLSNLYFKDRKKNLDAVEQEIGWEQIPTFLMGEYAATDVYLTFKHYLRTVAQLQHEDLISVYKDNEAYLKVLRKIIDRGIAIDLDLAKQLQEEGRRTLSALRDELGLDPAKAGQIIERMHTEFKVPVLYKTKGGKPATDSTSLVRYSEQYPHVKDFCSKVVLYRTTSKAVSTWYQGFQDKSDAHGLLHPGLQQTGTVTGRLSCREPNLQQVPRQGGTRRLFKDKGGKILVEFDYSQIELRLGSWYLMKKGDSTLYDAYSQGIDVHVTTAERLGLTRTLGAKPGRQLGKTCNFLLLYGGGPKRLKETIYKDSKGESDYSLQQCVQWVKDFRLAYPGVEILTKSTESKWKEVKTLRLWNGRKRHLDRFEDTHKAFNSVVQGGCGQVLMYALIELDRQMPELEIVNTVHDSVWIYIEEDQLEEIAERVVKIMRSIPETRFNMPFEVEWKRWSDTL